MTYRKFGRHRHRPLGKWVQATTAIDVVGTEHRLRNARRFAAAVAKAERREQPYGARLKLEPDNPHDRNAIAVLGWVRVKPFLRSARIAEWHIGYLPRDLAATLHAEMISQGIKIDVELYSIFIRGDYHEFRVIVLAPPGHSHSSKMRARRDQSSNH